MSSNQKVEPLRFVLLGKTGVGKSSLVNTMLEKNVCDIGGNGASVTKASARYPGKLADTKGDRDVEIYDTPGVYDTHGDDSKNIANMVKNLKGKYVDLFILVLNISEARLTPIDVGLLALFSEIFESQDRSWLENFCIVFTHWETGEEADEDRGDSVDKGAIEAHFAQEIFNATNYVGRYHYFYVSNKVFGKKRDGTPLRTREQQMDVRQQFNFMGALAESNRPFHCVDIKEAQDFITKLKSSTEKMKKQNAQLQEKHRAEKQQFNKQMESLRNDLTSQTNKFKDEVKKLEKNLAGESAKVDSLRSELASAKSNANKGGGMSMEALMPLFMMMGLGKRNDHPRPPPMPMIMGGGMPPMSPMGGMQHMSPMRGMSNTSSSNFRSPSSSVSRPLSWNEYRSSVKGLGLKAKGTGPGTLSYGFRNQM